MPADLTAVFKLELPIIVEIGERMLPLREVVSLGPGSLIELDKFADDDLEVVVNNKPIGSGKAVKVGENYGIRISRVGDASERIAAVDAGGPPLPRTDDPSAGGAAGRTG